MNARRLLTGALLALTALVAGGCHAGVYPNAALHITPTVALAGESITLDGSASTPDIAPDHKPVPIVRYRFDLNGDGLPEIESRKPRVAVSLPAENYCSVFDSH